MASPEENKRKDSKEQPPNMEFTLPSFLSGVNLLTSLVDSSISELQAQINKLREITDSVEKTHRNTTIVSLTGGVVAAVGGIAAAAALAPFTFGASLAVAQIGTAAAVAGGLTSCGSNLVNMHNQKVSRKDIEEALKIFKTKLSRITECLEGLQLKEEKLPVLAKLLSVATGLRVIDILDDIGSMAVRVSRSLKAAATISKALVGLTLVLNVFFVVSDAIELHRMDNGKEGSSKTLQFINEMRETIKTLQQVVDDIKSTKDTFKCLPASQ